MNWPLAWNIVVGTIPGLILGLFIRVWYLPDPKAFKLFVGCVLVYIGARMLWQVIIKRGQNTAEMTAEMKMRQQAREGRKLVENALGSNAVRTISWSLRYTEYEFYGQRFRFHTTGLFVLSLIVGLIGGVYGIGGGAIIAPFIVSFFGLPVHTIAGAALMGTCVTSVGGVIFYEVIGPYAALPGQSVRPDWLLGILFGVGGIAGMYLGASLQKYISASIIRPGLALVILILGLRYVSGFVM